MVMKPLIMREWDSVSGNGDMWENTDEAGGIGARGPNILMSSLPEDEVSPLSVNVLLTSRKSGLPNYRGNYLFTPSNRASPPTGSSPHSRIPLCLHLKGINLALPKETVTASPEAIAMQSKADFFQDLPTTLFFASRQGC